MAAATDIKPVSTPRNQSVSTDNTGSTMREYLYDVEAQKPTVSFFLPPYTLTPEHFRDFSLGPLTLHRLFLLAYLGGVTIGLYYLQNLIWRPSAVAAPGSWWTWLGLVWLVPLPSAIAWIIGALWFRYGRKLDETQPIAHNVAFRIVSRGTNADCLLATIRRCQEEMRKTPLFPYIVEVVTDGDAFVAPDDKDVLHTVVPDDYTPPDGARFKARALHFACLYSAVPTDTWIVHLDEESQPTSSCIKGIANMIEECESTGNVRRVGQGLILYHRAWKTHPLLTLADMRRTGDDIGHFFLQHRLGYTIFGLHGSYVVARQDVEQEIGFDVGPEGSITEDAWWILLAMERGIRTMWVDGHFEEQSTQGLVDFLKQRRRWYVGLWKVGLHCPVSVCYRALLLFNTFSWIIVPLVLPWQLIYLTLSIVYERHIVVVMRVLTNLILATSSAVYLTGLVANMREHGTPWYRGIFWLLLQLLLMPVFLGLEVVAILMALFSPFSQGAKGFHVVKKSAHIESETSSEASSSSHES